MKPNNRPIVLHTAKHQNTKKNVPTPITVGTPHPTNFERLTSTTSQTPLQNGHLPLINLHNTQLHSLQKYRVDLNKCLIQIYKQIDHTGTFAAHIIKKMMSRFILSILSQNMPLPINISFHLLNP